MKAKRHKERRVVEPTSPQDLENMRIVLKLKLHYHPGLNKQLLATGDAEIIEDCSNRGASPWGARYRDGVWVGGNLLGKQWMELRTELASAET
jgi:predicted NAD-dependent protein-ADP-ribosyltransferase YbiA (DUF1768 family)